MANIKYIDSPKESKIPEGWTVSKTSKKIGNFVQYQGRNYEIISKIERDYTAGERALRGLLGVIALIFSLCTLLFFKEVRNLFVKEKQTIRYALLKVTPEPTTVTSDPNSPSNDQNLPPEPSTVTPDPNSPSTDQNVPPKPSTVTPDPNSLSNDQNLLPKTPTPPDLAHPVSWPIPQNCELYQIIDGKHIRCSDGDIESLSKRVQEISENSLMRVEVTNDINFLSVTVPNYKNEFEAYTIEDENRVLILHYSCNKEAQFTKFTLDFENLKFDFSKQFSAEQENGILTCKWPLKRT